MFQVFLVLELLVFNVSSVRCPKFAFLMYAKRPKLEETYESWPEYLSLIMKKFDFPFLLLFQFRHQTSRIGDLFFFLRKITFLDRSEQISSKYGLCWLAAKYRFTGIHWDES